MDDHGKYFWLEDDEYGWLPAKMIDSDNANFKFQINIDGKIMDRKEPRDKQYSEVHTSCLYGVDDLLLLGDLDQQTLLHNTRVRHSKDSIYTFIGMPILIAMNPYRSLPIYNDDTIKFYKEYFLRLRTNPNGITEPKPHLYHIAEAAYQDMINEKKNQSIIISGESGSGKTESTKIILKYLAVSSLHSFDSLKLNSNDNSNENNNITVEKQVLDSNPLLEAFGNAKTVKNNNSSRFGKFIQINFSENGKILSAKIYNYLLEKTRVTHISPEERNYHIFYQLIRGADEREKKRFNIKPLEYFNYLKHGCFDVEDNNDALNFQETKECMMKLKFKPEEISYIFSVLMGILYLGNVQFAEGEADSVTLDPSSKQDFSYSAEMLGLEQTQLMEILCFKKLRDPSSGEAIMRKLTLEKCFFSRDAISRAIYSKVFDYILRKINFAISNSDEMKAKKNTLKIGLLDIFGFENFQLNSFEQLCINYANERLQQYFNNHIFKMEQEEYKKENIDYASVEFRDNKEIIELIDASKNSIFSFLDSEAFMVNGSDENFENNIYTYLKDHPNLAEKVEEYIGIHHYAGEVYYHTEGFLKKNIDQLSQDIFDALEKSKNKLIKKIFEKKEDSKSKGNSGNNNQVPSKLQSDSLSKQFKKQLDDLLKMLTQSNPRYIKCIKPNSLKKAKIIESLDVMDQLLSAGVLEAIKIRKQGYSIRRSNEEFTRRYMKLYPDICGKIKIYEEKNDFREAVVEMCSYFAGVEDMKVYFDASRKIQIGLTKTFMKEDVKNILEFKLNKIKYIQILQNNIRRFIIQKIVKKKLKTIRKIQALYRGYIARIYANSLKLCVKIQRAFRRHLKRSFILSNLKLLSSEYRKKKQEELKKKENETKNSELQKQHKNNLDKSGSNSHERDNNSYNKSNNSENKEFYDNSDDKSLRKKGNNKVNSVTKKSKDWESIVLLRKESVNDLSTTDVQLVNELKGIGSRKIHVHKKRDKEKKHFADLFTSNVGSVLDSELKASLRNLKEELDQVKQEKEHLIFELSAKKEELRKKDLEIELAKNNSANNTYKMHLENLEKMDLVEKANFLTDQERSKYQEEIKRLKNDVFDRESQIDILNLKVDELSKNNKDLNRTIETLNEQMAKKREKIDKEMENLSNQIRELDVKKSEFGSQLIQLAGRFGQNINIEELMRNLNFNNYMGETNLILGANANLTNQQIRKSVFPNQQGNFDPNSSSGYNSNNYNLLNSNNNNYLTPEVKKQLADLKSENKSLVRKMEDLRSKYERELINIKTESDYKETKMRDLENALLKKEKMIENLLNQNFSCKSEIDFTKLKLDNFTNKVDKIDEWDREIAKFKKDFELLIRKRDLEINDLKDTLDTVHLNLDRSRKMEIVLKTEIKNRENDLEKTQEKLFSKLTEIDTLNDEIINLKKENYNLKSSLTLGEIEFKNKFELENQLRNQEMKLLKDNVEKYNKYIFDLKENIERKRQIISNKKQMNVILCDLARIKKGEIQCLETLQYNNSESVKKSLLEIRKSEKELLIKLNEISNFPDYSDSEDDLSDDFDDDESDD